MIKLVKVNVKNINNKSLYQILNFFFFVSVWNKGKKSCWRTFKHSYAVVAVAISEDICVTGGNTGKLKVFHLLSGQLIKVRGVFFIKFLFFLSS